MRNLLLPFALLIAAPIAAQTVNAPSIYVFGFEHDGAFHAVITRSSPTTGTTTVDFATADGTAKAGVNYVATSGTLTFHPGDTSKTIDVTILDNAIYNDPGRDFTIALSNVQGGTLGNDTAYCQIFEDDPPPVVHITGVVQAEGNGGWHDATVTMQLTGATAVNGMVAMFRGAGDGLVDWSQDLQWSSPFTWNFTPADIGSTKTFTYQINGDTLHENDEVFTFHTDCFGCNTSVDDANAHGNAFVIVDDDSAAPPPPLSRLLLTPATLRISEGRTTTIEATLVPPQSQVVLATLASSDPSIATVPASVMIPPGGVATIPVSATRSGRVTISGSVTTADATTATAAIVDVARDFDVTLVPSLGAITGGTVVAISGDGVLPSCGVLFDGAPPSQLWATAGNVLMATVPPHVAGNVDVTIACSDMTTLLGDAFAYAAPRLRRARH